MMESYGVMTFGVIDANVEPPTNSQSEAANATLQCPHRRIHFPLTSLPCTMIMTPTFLKIERPKIHKNSLSRSQLSHTHCENPIRNGLSA